MTMKRFTRILPIILVSLLLSACGSSVPAGSWPGISIDEQNGNAYVAFGQEVYALQLDNGAERWHYPAERKASFSTFAAPQLTEDGQLLVAGYDQTVYSLDPANGNSNWTFAGATNRYIGNPLVTANGSFAPNSDGKLYALDANGSLLWTFAAEQPLWSQPVMVGDVLVVSSMDHNVYGLNAQTGEEIWTLAAGGAIVSSPGVGEDGTVYIGTLNKKVLAINAANGREVWSFEAPGWVWGSPAYFDGQLYIGDLDGTVISLDASTGRETWSVDTEGAITGAPLVVDDHLYVVNENGQVISFALDGTIQWTKNIEAALYGSPIAAGDLILIGVGTADSVVTAFNQNGDTAWTFVPPATK
jgi:outer membrane protein assembly factor BamB